MYQKLKKTIVCGGLIVALAITNAAAASVEEPLLIIENQILSMEGTLSDAKPYANITAEVYYPGYSPEDVDITSGDYISQMKEAIFWMGQTNLSRDLTYELNLDMEDAPPGEYLIRVYAAGAEETYETRVFYSSLEQQKELIEEIVQAETAEEVKEILNLTDENSTIARVFRLTDPLYFSADAVNTAKLLYEYNQNQTIDSADSDKFKEILLLCSLADNLSQGKQFDIMKYSEIFNPDEAFADTYNKRLGDSAREVFTQSFRGRELKDAEDIQTAFAEQVFIAVVNNIRNWADIEYVIETHGADALIDLDMDEYEDCTDKEELAVELAKDTPYSSVDDFNDNMVKEAGKIKPPSKGSSSGSSGGGGGGSGKISVGTPPVIPEIPADDFADPQSKTAVFSDLDSVVWAKESIEYLAEKNIVSGTDTGVFEPDRDIKREEFIKMLILAFSEVDGDAECSFSDVPAESWFGKYAATAEQLGVLKGYDDGRMGAGETLTREDIAALSCRMATHIGINLPSVSGEPFPDDSSIADYASDAVYALKNAGVINGMGDGTFAPKQHCTRAQAAMIIYGLIKLEGDK